MFLKALLVHLVTPGRVRALKLILRKYFFLPSLDGLFILEGIWELIVESV